MNWLYAPLQTERLSLRAATGADAELFERILTNPDTRKYLGGPIGSGALARKIADLPGNGVFIAERIIDQIKLGLIYVGRYRTGDLELSYELLPEYWGNGYAVEACNAVLDWTFATFLGVDRIVAVTQAANGASLSLAARVGMTEVDRFEEWGEPQVMLARYASPGADVENSGD